MKASRRELLGKALRGAFFGTVLASFAEGMGGVDPRTGRCDCPFCRGERAWARRSVPASPAPSPTPKGEGL